MLEEVKFSDLGISADILAAIEKKGFVTPSPIQQQTIPLLLNDTKDIIGQAQTGTGKTAAFGIPILEKIEPGLRKVQALVLTPTRELAMQVTEEIISFKGKRNARILPVYGGQGMEFQIKQLREGVDIVVGTPGRVIDHIESGRLRLDDIKFFVLDEADEMLNMGFLEDVEKILQKIPASRHMLLFSATMPDRIRQIAKAYMNNPHLVKIEKKAENAPQIEQVYYEVYGEDKKNALCRIIDASKEFYALIFCKTKSGTDELANALIEKGYPVEALHGDVSQHQREVIMRKFKTRRSSIMVATDVAARGIDVNDMTHVINYDIPGDGETYTHRIGRTGRAGKKGVAITLITPSETRKFQFMMRDANMTITKGKLPTATEVVEKKKSEMFEEISSLIAEENYTQFAEMAQSLMEVIDHEAIISALLLKAYGTQLDVKHYAEIREPSRRENGRSDYGSSYSSRPKYGNDRYDDRRPSGERRFGDRDRNSNYGNGERRPVERTGGYGSNPDRKPVERTGGYGTNPDRRPGFRKEGESTYKKEYFNNKEGGEKKFSGNDDRPIRRENSKYEVLFLAKGSKDGITNRIVTELIKDETGIPSHKIYEIDVFPKHTIFKVNHETAESILEKFKSEGGKGPLVRKDRRI